MFCRSQKATFIARLIVIGLAVSALWIALPPGSCCCLPPACWFFVLWRHVTLLKSTQSPLQKVPTLQNHTSLRSMHNIQNLTTLCPKCAILVASPLNFKSSLLTNAALGVSILDFISPVHLAPLVVMLPNSWTTPHSAAVLIYHNLFSVFCLAILITSLFSMSIYT